MSKKIILVYSGPHKPQMEALKEWLVNNLPQYEYILSSQFLLSYKIRKNQPECVITYNKDLMKKNNTKSIISFCAKGGKVIALHHNVSSMMMKRPEWLDFMKIRIEKGENVEYPWSVIEGGDLYLTNLQPGHPITTEGIDYDSKVPVFNLTPNSDELTIPIEMNKEQQEEFKSRDKQPAIEFKKSEYFINHIPLPESKRTLLFGIYFTDPPSGREFISNNGGWMMPYKKGTIFYLMPGHSVHDYHDIYCKIIRNIILFK